MDIIIFSIIIFIISKMARTDSEFLSISNTNKLKGISILSIIFVHMNGLIENTGSFYDKFLASGYIFVAVFFFISGYGLVAQYLKNKGSYLKSFFKKRLLKIIIPYILANIIWYGFYYYHNHIQFTLTIQNIKDAVFLVDASWYIVTIIIFYIIFFFVFLACRGRILVANILMIIFIGLYILLCIQHSFTQAWYISSFTFVIGIIYKSYEHKIKPLILKYYTPFMIFCLISFSLFKMFDNQNGISVVSNLTSILFAMLFIHLGYKIQYESKIISFIGDISFEIYMLHMIPIIFFKSEYIYINNDILFACVVIICSILLGYVLNKIDRKVFSVFLK